MRSTTIAGIAVSFALMATPAATAQPTPEGGRTAHTIRQQLQPAYLQLKTDPTFDALRRQVATDPRDEAAVDRYLQYLPMSPKELLELEMHTRRFEIVIPEFVLAWHERWISLHQDEARALYGDPEVEGVLARAAEAAASAPAVSGGVPAKTADALVGPNRNAAATFGITPENYQGEYQVAVNPHDPNEIVVGANTFDNAGGTCAGNTQAVFYSNDGGTTWGYTCAPDTTAYEGLFCPGFQFGSDPALAWNAQGEVFIEYMLLCTLDGINFQFSIVIAKSTDAGATWSAQGVVANSYDTPNQLEDKEFLAIDDTPSSPFYGRMYTCWDRNNNQKSAYSDDDGQTWTEVDLPAADPTTFDLGCDLAIARDGTVHIVFDTLDCGAIECTNERMFAVKSTDGGDTWSVPNLVRDFNLVSFNANSLPAAQSFRGIGPFGAIGIDNTGGPCDGTLYVGFAEFLSGDSNQGDIWVSRSLDGGATWEPIVQVNDDGVGGNAQFNPFLVVDQSNGHVVLAWRDARHSATNTSTDVYIARSTDCGQTFEANLRVTQPSAEFNNDTVTASEENPAFNPGFNPNQYGDYLGIEAIEGKAYVAWTDTRHFFPDFTTETQKENMGFAVVAFPQELTFTSKRRQDGFVVERGENSDVGAFAVSFGLGGLGLRVGDTFGDRQLKSVVSFDTSSIPDDATIVSATLRLRRGAVIGSNPFDGGFGDLVVDIAQGVFGSSGRLRAEDFQAPAAALGVATMSAPLVGDWSEGALDVAGLAAIDKTGRTQLRIAFEIDDNDDHHADLIGFFAGDSFFPSLRPQLIVTYR